MPSFIEFYFEREYRSIKKGDHHHTPTIPTAEAARAWAGQGECTETRGKSHVEERGHATRGDVPKVSIWVMLI